MATFIESVDQVAAANLARNLELALDGDKIINLARHLAEHRLDSLNFALSRARSSISDASRRALQPEHRRQSAEWGEGFRSAEAEMLIIVARLFSEMRPPPQRSRGQILRAMIQSAKRKVALNPEYEVVEVGPSSAASSA